MRHKIWLVLLLSFVLGCGNGQNGDGEKQIENVTKTEVLEQEDETKTEIQEQTEILKKQENATQRNWSVSVCLLPWWWFCSFSAA